MEVKMLRITGLQKSYKRFPVLRNLNMNIDKGDVYGLVGTNGFGKTTTMNIICNTIPKDEGNIAFENSNARIGYLPEMPALYGYMNGFEYLDYIGACCGYIGDIKARTAEVLRLTGMFDCARRLIKGYSRGMNQRIGIAAAIYANPDLLILDEPTSALDPAGRADVMEIIRRLAASGSTIILCTHILTDVERVANKVGIIRHGLMAVEGKLPEIIKMFGGSTAVYIQLRYPPLASDPLCTLDIVERSELGYGGLTLYAKQDVSEAELYNKVITTLAENGVLPEYIGFRRLTLEQIYIGINNDFFRPVQHTANISRMLTELYANSGSENPTQQSGHPARHSGLAELRRINMKLQTKASIKKEYLAFFRTNKFMILAFVIVGLAIFNPLLFLGLGTLFDSFSGFYDEIGMDISSLSDALSLSVSTGVSRAVLDIAQTGLIVFLLVINSNAGGEQKKRSIMIPRSSGLRSFGYIFPKFIIYPLAAFVLAMIATLAAWGISLAAFKYNDVSPVGVVLSGALAGVCFMFFICAHITIGTATGRAGLSAAICIIAVLLLPSLFVLLGSDLVYNPFTISVLAGSVVSVEGLSTTQPLEVIATVLIAFALMVIFFLLALFAQNAKKIDNSGNEIRI
jgi:ABC-2 type transport system ATP-binding protein